MPLRLEGSCRCGAVRFTCDTHAPVPYQRCYCSICCKTAGGGGYAINLSADTDSLKVEDPGGAVVVYRAEIRDETTGACRTSTAERRHCARCGSALWAYSPEWPELIHPFASAVDTDLPVPPATTHLMLKYRPAWVVPQIGEGDLQFELYPEESIEDWHKRHGVWVP
jgi:hypothetical protein